MVRFSAVSMPTRLSPSITSATAPPLTAVAKQWPGPFPAEHARSVHGGRNIRIRPVAQRGTQQRGARKQPDDFIAVHDGEILLRRG